MKIWYEDSIKIKNNQVIVKLYDEENKFIKSIVLPTKYYPLNDNPEVFHYKNTQKLKNETIVKVFNKVKYLIGHCYTNTEELVKELRKEGIEAKSYVGWLFTEKGQPPIHHCWVVVNGNTVLDLSDDFTVMLCGENGKNFESLETKIERAQMIASFHKAAKEVENSIRCSPVGTPTPFLLYVGCECDPNKGREIYRNLVLQYPDHECQRNVDKDGYTDTQRIMRNSGLIR